MCVCVWGGGGGRNNSTQNKLLYCCQNMMLHRAEGHLTEPAANNPFS